MIDAFDPMPYTLQEKEERLAPARVLSEAGIECLIYGEDALAFVHSVPTGLFSLHIIVADHHQKRASEEIMLKLPYKHYTDIHPHHNDRIQYDPARTRTFFNSTYLECTGPNDGVGIIGSLSPIVIIHPQSHFNVDVKDYSRSISHPPFPENIRFPTFVAFLDSLFEAALDPPSGRVTDNSYRLFVVWISYLFEYNLRNKPAVLENGDLEPDHAEVKRQLRPEHQDIFDCISRDTMKVIGQAAGLKMRRDALRRLGRHDLSEKPLPKYPPGNPEIRARLKALREQSKSLSKAESPSVPLNAGTGSTPSPVQQPVSKRAYSTMPAPALRNTFSVARKLARFIR
ncbi:hypothetical protein CPC08DRAFT_708097 [Agrocybe pediades]|nr:hypothetical protein CPC08DRAFT_708097 [Agrocybe pediades]